MINPLLSIITVNYNSGNDLLKTILSIKPILDNLNCECLIIDGLSSDNSLNSIFDFHQSIKIISEKDFGIYDAMNKGIVNSRGKWIWFVNAGDKVLIDPYYLKTALLSDKNFIYSDFITNNKVRIIQKFSIYKIFRSMLNHQSIIYSKNIVGFYDLSYGLSADYANLLNNFNSIKPFKIDYPLIEYNLCGASSKINRISRFKIWIQRSRAIVNSQLPFHYKFLGALFSIICALIKLLFPNALSKISKLKNVS